MNKRKNVKEFEARLSLVEGLLKNATESKPGDLTSPITDARGDVNLEDGSPESGSGDGSADIEFVQDDTVSNIPESYGGGNGQFLGQPAGVDFFNTQELMGLGMFEVPPPSDVIDEMHTNFFQKQQTFIPLVHPARYLKAYHSAPHMRPPMALQYAVWAMAALDMDKYSAFYDPYYRRARQYLEADELKGVGEHFITVSHAQAWILIAWYEARNMKFTRSAMSCARGLKLCHMMGLHSLDQPDYLVQMIPTIPQPQNWAELEERRRTFWGAFCVDSHASIATGWPSMIDPNTITTKVPSSEEAFVSGNFEKANSLKELFLKGNYSTFAGKVGISHILNQIIGHIHPNRSDDRPENVEYGPFWKRHRDIDNVISSAFMFLPEKLRLPQNYRNPFSVFMNLNLHASVICLHQSAVDRAVTNKLPETIKQNSMIRLINSADEIINIVKQAVNLDRFGTFRNPLIALSVYCAASVYMSLSWNRGAEDGDQGNSDKSQPLPSHLDAIEFAVQCLTAIARIHPITHAFLRQILVDLEFYNLTSLIRVPPIDFIDITKVAPNIPLLVRSSLAKHAETRPWVPGHLFHGKPAVPSHGKTVDRETAPIAWVCADEQPRESLPETNRDEAGTDEEGDKNRGKRRRMSGRGSGDQHSNQDMPQTNDVYIGGWKFSSGSSDTMGFSGPSISAFPQQQQQQQRQMSGVAAGPPGLLSPFQTALPHRNGHSEAGSSGNTPAATSSGTYSTTSVASDGGGFFGPSAPGLADDQTGLMAEMWSATEVEAFVNLASATPRRDPSAVPGSDLENQSLDVSWDFIA